MKRKTETPAMVRRIMVAQGVIPCCLCGKRLMPGDKLIREHKHALVLGGKDDEANMGYAHEECAKLKTSGPAHYSKGSDISNGAAIKRHQKGGKTIRHPMPKTNRKLQTKPFKSDWKPNTKFIHELDTEIGDPNGNE